MPELWRVCEVRRMKHDDLYDVMDLILTVNPEGDILAYVYDYQGKRFVMTP